MGKKVDTKDKEKRRRKRSNSAVVSLRWKSETSDRGQTKFIHSIFISKYSVYAYSQCDDTHTHTHTHTILTCQGFSFDVVLRGGINSQKEKKGKGLWAFILHDAKQSVPGFSHAKRKHSNTHIENCKIELKKNNKIAKFFLAGRAAASCWHIIGKTRRGSNYFPSPRVIISYI
jgi:hypothetical protein